MIAEDLIVRLKHADAAERRRALEEAARDPDPDHLACLIEAIDDRHTTVRTTARRLLKKLTKRDYGLSREGWSGWWREYAHLACQTCKRRLYDQKLYYRVKAEVTSEPREVVITDEDLAGDTQAKLDLLCKEMKSTPAEDLADEVWVRVDYFLCTSCKKTYVKAARKPPRPEN